MTPKEHLIAALITLCEREGGYKVVADTAGVNDQTLYQVINGVELPSGEPRGVGPTVARKLDAVYPGWSGLGKVKALPSRSQADQETLMRLGALLARVQPSLRPAVAEALAGWAREGGADHWRVMLVALLNEPRRKQSNAPK